MIKRIFVFCTMVVIAVCFAGCGSRNAGKYRAVACDYVTHKVGYIDEFGTWVIEPKYEEGEGFLAGRTIVKMQGKQIVIDKDGNEEKNPHFAKGKLVRDEEGNVYIRCKGSLANKDRELENVYNEKGDLLIENVLLSDSLFNHGFIYAGKRMWKFGCYSKSGKAIATYNNLSRDEFGKIEMIYPLSKNVVQVICSKRGSVYIDSNGTEISKLKNYHIDGFHDGVAFAWGLSERNNKFYVDKTKCYLVDEKGEVIKDLSGCTWGEINICRKSIGMKEGYFAENAGGYRARGKAQDVVSTICDINRAVVGKYEHHHPRGTVSDFYKEYALIGYSADSDHALFYFGVIDKTGRVLFKNEDVELFTLNESGLLRGRFDDLSFEKWDKNGHRKKAENFFDLNGRKKFKNDFLYVRDYVKVE